jgi:para-nitrobenzyl esterase
VRDCLAWGPLAPQGASQVDPSAGLGADFQLFFGAEPDAPSAMSEDCLTLNVFTPAIDDHRRRPVLVWIHGGGFSIGTGSGARANGSHLAERQDVVTVSINHRLGVFGYCHLGMLDSDFSHSGNAGQLDLIAALEWIRQNIAAFGGDPRRVMVHGESGGGGKIGTLLGMPKAQSLFARAILQSGSANKLPTVEQATVGVELLLKELGIASNDVRKLQDVPVEQLIAAGSKIENAQQGGPRTGWVPTQGTRDVPRAPLETVASGSARIPLVIGNTHDEMALMLAGAGTDPSTITSEQLTARAQAMYGDNAAELLDGYRTNHPDLNPGDLLVRMMTDDMRVESIRLAEAQTRAGHSAYMYLFTWESPVLPQLKAAHGIDGTFYFDNTESVAIAQGNPEAQALATAASSAWANFARSGTPEADGLPEWPKYSLGGRETMILSASPHIENDPLGDDRKLRERLT